MARKRWRSDALHWLANAGGFRLARIDRSGGGALVLGGSRRGLEVYAEPLRRNCTSLERVLAPDDCSVNSMRTAKFDTVASALFNQQEFNQEEIEK
jgi:hypothetical protein